MYIQLGETFFFDWRLSGCVQLCYYIKLERIRKAVQTSEGYSVNYSICDI